jgi:hypothetical protein
MTSVTSLVRNAPTRALNRAFAGAHPDSSYDLELSPHIKGARVPYIGIDEGENAHAAISALIRGEWADRRFWPYACVIRDWMSDIGVQRVWTDWHIQETGRFVGSCDLLVSGGPRSSGVIEVKFVNRGLPEFHRMDHLFQLSLYARGLAEMRGGFDRYWGAIAYVCPSARTIRVFEWTVGMPRCCQSADFLLRAA